MMCGLIDLNTVNDDSDDVSTASSGSGSAPAVCCLELWHACAGPSLRLPEKGNAVVYCPQGHLEQLQSGDDYRSSGDFVLPPHVFCRVLDVKLHAVAGTGTGTGTDDVYAQVSLIQDPQLEKKWREGGEDENGVVVENTTTTPHMFCKTLTASDTSTHGGFSVPRRAAEDCFPPLDYEQQRPSQELVAKDLHGIEWKFRHIYRGQPRRHLLTTGWSLFVNKKKLVCGDAVLFLRGDDGVLRIGIRRATQAKMPSSLPPSFSQKSDFDFSTVVNSISQRRLFIVCYNPRGGSSEFIVPYNRFSSSLANSFSHGMRFKMRVETDDAGDRRSRGIIIGLKDINPKGWPGSKWRCLMVQWDCQETMQNRVSPWEIELCDSASDAGSFFLPLMKRTRTSFPLVKPDCLVLKDQSTGALSNFRESMQFYKDLQGQEINDFFCASEISQLGKNIRNPTTVGFSESLRFNRVLQGQEITTQQYGEILSNSGNLWIRPSSLASPSSVRFQQDISQVPNTYPICYPDKMKLLSGQNHQDLFCPLKSQLEEPVLTSKNSLRVFGFSLTEGSAVTQASRCANDEDHLHLGSVVNSKVGGSCTNDKVHQWCQSSDGFLLGL
ncbi:hypothetical protein R6Q57_013609 [Mikania cordata]